MTRKFYTSKLEKTLASWVQDVSKDPLKDMGQYFRVKFGGIVVRSWEGRIIVTHKNDIAGVCLVVILSGRHSPRFIM